MQALMLAARRYAKLPNQGILIDYVVENKIASKDHLVGAICSCHTIFAARS